MKRGQSEIIGLVIVVLILVFALLFFVKIRDSDDDNESRLIRSNLRANSALNALMKENINFKEQMKDQIQKCVYSGDGGSDDCKITSDKLNKTIKDKIGFDVQEYWMVVRTRDEKKLIYSGIECRGGISASPFILRNGGIVDFKICT